MLFKITTLTPKNSTLVCVKSRSALLQHLVGHLCIILFYLHVYSEFGVSNLLDIYVLQFLLSCS